MENLKLFVLGLDGATWNVIDPLIKSGKLPNIKKIKENGSYGYLESTFPPNTIPAWLSMATGKNPCKLGVYDFFKKEKSNSQFSVVNSNEFRKNNSYWDLLNQTIFTAYYQMKPELTDPIGDFTQNITISAIC